MINSRVTMGRSNSTVRLQRGNRALPNRLAAKRRGTTAGAAREIAFWPNEKVFSRLYEAHNRRLAVRRLCSAGGEIEPGGRRGA